MVLYTVISILPFRADQFVHISQLIVVIVVDVALHRWDWRGGSDAFDEQLLLLLLVEGAAANLLMLMMHCWWIVGIHNNALVDRLNGPHELWRREEFMMGMVMDVEIVVAIAKLMLMGCGREEHRIRPSDQRWSFRRGIWRWRWHHRWNRKIATDEWSKAREVP